MVFGYLRDFWADSVHLVSDTAPVQNDTEAFVSVNTHSYSHVLVYSLRYGAVTHHRGVNTSYAYANGRIPVQIQYLFHIQHERRDANLPTLEHICAVVRPFQNNSPDVPFMPWGLQ